MKDHAQSAEDLALYAMGTLDDQESRELEAHLGTCGECRRELDSLRGDLALLALSATGPQPPQRSRERLQAAISEEQRQTSVPESAAVLPRLYPRWLTLAPAAIAVVLAATSLGLLLEVQRLKEANASIVVRLQDEIRKNAHAKDVLAMLEDPQAQNVTLSPTQTHRQPQIRTIYQKDKGHVLLLATNLEPIPDDKVYELWLLPAGGGAPMPSGTFRIDNKGNSLMLHALETGGIEAAGFAVTVEKVGGSKVPTPPIVYAPAS